MANPAENNLFEFPLVGQPTRPNQIPTSAIMAVDTNILPDAYQFAHCALAMDSHDRVVALFHYHEAMHPELVTGVLADDKYTKQMNPQSPNATCVCIRTLLSPWIHVMPTCIGFALINKDRRVFRICANSIPLQDAQIRRAEKLSIAEPAFNVGTAGARISTAFRLKDGNFCIVVDDPKEIRFAKATVSILSGPVSGDTFGPCHVESSFDTVSGETVRCNFVNGDSDSRGNIYLLSRNFFQCENISCDFTGTTIKVFNRTGDNLSVLTPESYTVPRHISLRARCTWHRIAIDSRDRLFISGEIARQMHDNPAARDIIEGTQIFMPGQYPTARSDEDDSYPPHPCVLIPHAIGEMTIMANGSVAFFQTNSQNGVSPILRIIASASMH